MAQSAPSPEDDDSTAPTASPALRRRLAAETDDAPGSWSASRGEAKSEHPGHSDDGCRSLNHTRSSGRLPAIHQPRGLRRWKIGDQWRLEYLDALLEVGEHVRRVGAVRFPAATEELFCRCR